METASAGTGQHRRVAVLVKQIPSFGAMTLGPGGRLVRDGVELEMNAYCRRAVAKGVELARGGGACTVYTLGPPSAREVLREAIACGADRGVLITDPALAGSDTLATARALAAALRRDGPFDVIVLGRNSVDADTGQVGPELAELLDLPFLPSVRELNLEEGWLQARCEVDDGWLDMAARPPLVMSMAERSCSPCKAPPEVRAAIPDERIRVLDAAALGPGPWGLAGSPTRVGPTRSLALPRARRVLEGPVTRQAREAIELLIGRGALRREPPKPAVSVPRNTPGRGPVVGVLVEPGRPRVAQELCGEAARLAHELGGHVVACVDDEKTDDTAALGAWGADRALAIEGAAAPEDFARAAARWATDTLPSAVLGPSTIWGREVAGRVAARLGAGLTGDAIELEIRDGRLVAWKPAFGGQLVAAITASSPVQMATVRPGVLPRPQPRDFPAPLQRLQARPRGRIRLGEHVPEDSLAPLAGAACVVGVGTGVAPEEYAEIASLQRVLGAELAATRKVTDRGWLPRARQVGVTGHSIAPRLYVAIGVGGKLNHTIGVRGAGTVLAINRDPSAPIADAADIVIVADWHAVLPELVDELVRRGVGEAR